jgi:purine-binding chemotaxis protein CheW
LVDAVSEVIRIAPGDIEPPPDFGSSVRRDFIRGIGKVGARFIILLEPDRALDVQEMADLCEQAQEPAGA